MLKKALLSFFMSVSLAASANVSLPRIFSDHMVLQRNKPIHIWGWAAAGETVKVSLGHANKSIKANKQGKWEVFLPQMPAGGPHTLSVTGRNTIQLKDILIGEVWICSGQSNMEWPLSSSANAEQEIRQANYPMIRHFKVPRTTALQPQHDVQSGQWEVCRPETAPQFTAVGYFFAREIYKELNVPIGLINTSWGGSMIETWISHPTFFSHSEFAGLKSRMPGSMDSLLQLQRLSLETLVRNGQGSLPSPADERNFMLTEAEDASWKTMKLPSAWENAGLPELDGEVWFRYAFEFPATASGSQAVISLGPIDDADSTFLNGQLIGVTNAYNTPRLYKIPDGLLKPGRNVIAVKVTDHGGGGGMYGQPSQMKLQAQDVTISLAGNWKYRISRYQSNIMIGPNQYPTLLYNGMVHPLVGYAVAGFLWYQGETNAGRSAQYKTTFPLMINDWRKQWKEELPFYFVQLANFNAANGSNSTGGSGWAELREAQTATLDVPKTGMAVTIDIGNSKDIHPTNKQDVGKRLALSALAKTYGKDIVYSGPALHFMEIKDHRAILSFAFAEGGFLVKNKYGYINGFEIAGADQKFYYARAIAEGDKIIVSSDSVPKPVAVRYAWADDPNDVNLYNKAGLPALPFRTDNWKGITADARYRF
jgi:sialate O-acetylesterase